MPTRPLRKPAKNSHKKYYWMRVSLDEFEEVECIADTRVELANMCRVKPESISESMSRAKRLNHRCVYVKMLKEDEED